MSTQLQQALDEGYSAEEITNFLSKKDQNTASKIKQARESGYSPKEIISFLGKQNQTTPPQAQHPQENIASQVTRTIAQAPQGLAEGTPLGIATNLLNLAGRGEAIAELDELEERLPMLKERFPQLKWPEKIDREKYMEAVESATNYFPTVGNLARIIEEKTGIPLEPHSPLDKAVRFITSLGTFAHGSIPQKTLSALEGEIAKELAQHAGLPDPVAEGIGVAYALRPKSVEGPKLPKERKISPEAKQVEELVGKPTSLPTGAGPELVIDAEPLGGGGPTFKERFKELIKSPVKEAEKLIGETPKSRFETAEKAVKELNPMAEIKPIQIEAKFATSEAKPLEAHRVNPEPELGSVISKDSFHSEAQGGRSLSSHIKERAEALRKPIKAAYKEAEAITTTHNDFFIDLAHKNDSRIAALENIQKRNAGQEAVYQQALAIRDLVGREGAYIEANADRLMKQGDSMSKLANYELPYTGYKQNIKEMVRDINQATIASLEKSGKDAATVVKADKLYAQWADQFLGDSISPFLDKKIENPEALFRKAAKDEATYRAVKNAIGSRDHPLMQKLDKIVVEEHMGKYAKESSKVGTKEYTKDLLNLNELVGKEKTAEVDSFLRKKQQTAERTKRLIREPAASAKKVPEAGQKKLKAVAERAAKVSKIPPEELLKQLDSRTGIKQLRKEISEETFDTLTRQKIKSILGENNIHPHYKGKDMYELLNKEKNFEIFSEIIGQEATQAALDAYELIGNREASSEAFLQLPGIRHVSKPAIKFYKFVQPLVPIKL